MSRRWTRCDAFGDVRAAAARLYIHPNTLRYRIRRAQELTGLDLSPPQQRLLAALQLRLSPGGGAAEELRVRAASVR
jgi:DNA-binding PucR family transcriptional regulator